MKLETVKVGDKLLVTFGYHGKEICEVDRVTAKYVACGKRMFDKRRGRQRGASSGWTSISATVTTPKDVAELQHQQLAGKIAGISPLVWLSLTMEQLQAIESIVESA